MRVRTQRLTQWGVRKGLSYIALTDSAQIHRFCTNSQFPRDLRERSTQIFIFHTFSFSHFVAKVIKNLCGITEICVTTQIFSHEIGEDGFEPSMRGKHINNVFLYNIGTRYMTFLQSRRPVMLPAPNLERARLAKIGNLFLCTQKSLGLFCTQICVQGIGICFCARGLCRTAP